MYRVTDFDWLEGEPYQKKRASGYAYGKSSNTNHILEKAVRYRLVD